MDETRDKAATVAICYRAVRHFFAWSEHHQLGGLDDIEPLHIAAYVEQLHGNM